MGKILSLFALVAMAIATSGCKNGQPAPALQSVITAATDVGCAVEKAAAGGFGEALVAATGAPASQAAACSNDLIIALGNANLCKTSVSSASTASPSFAKIAAAHPQWKTLGDISQKDLDDAKVAKAAKGAVHDMAMHSLGIVGSLVCPIADGTIVGLLSGMIPTACQGPQSLGATAANQIFEKACELAIPL